MLHCRIRGGMNFSLYDNIWLVSEGLQSSRVKCAHSQISWSRLNQETSCLGGHLHSLHHHDWMPIKITCGKCSIWLCLLYFEIKILHLNKEGFKLGRFSFSFWVSIKNREKLLLWPRISSDIHQMIGFVHACALCCTCM